MKRLHIHIAVSGLDRSIRYYTTLFGTAPDVHKTDYAKWMLDDPRLNFAISARGQSAGLDHLGIQVEDDDALRAVSARLAQAGEQTREECDTTCCYARADKTWSEDPSGIRWETFHTHGESTVYGTDSASAHGACCSTGT